MNRGEVESKDAQLGQGSFGFELAVGREAPGRARAGVERALSVQLGVAEGGARLAAGLLTRTLVTSCICGERGAIAVSIELGPEVVRVEVSGAGPGFRLPLSERAIDYPSFDDLAAQPVGWRSYLLDRLADGWGLDPDAGCAWFEVDHSSSEARRLGTREPALSA